MTYKELLIKIANREGFCPDYTVSNLSVKEVFTHLDNYNIARQWKDKADNKSLEHKLF